MSGSAIVLSLVLLLATFLHSFPKTHTWREAGSGCRGQKRHDADAAPGVGRAAGLREPRERHAQVCEKSDAEGPGRTDRLARVPRMWFEPAGTLQVPDAPWLP
jgi:hypothetical protein